MNIAILGHLHFPIAQPYAGGLESHTANLIYELQRQGHQTTLYAARGSSMDLNVIPIFDGDAQDGRNPGIATGYRWAVAHISRQDYDLVINNTFNPIPIELLPRTGVPTLTILHTPPLPPMVAAIRSLRKQVFDGNMQFAGVSDLTAGQWAVETFQPVTTIYNGVRTHGYHKKQIRTDDPYLVWSGRITREKGTHIAIEAALQAGMPLKLIGSVYDARYYENIIRPLLDSPSIEYIGHIGDESIKTIYRGASVALVTPLWDEPFGLVTIEALLSGTPVAALPNGAVHELIVDKVGCVAKSEEPDALVSAIYTAMQKKSSDCIEYARKNFNLTRMVSDYLTLMQPMVEGAAEEDIAACLPVPA